MTNYYRGRRREWRTKHYLQRRMACPLIIRSTKSSTPIDIVAVFPEPAGIRFIQVKSGATLRVSPEEILQLRKIAADRPRDRVEIWYWKLRSRQPIIYKVTEEGGLLGIPIVPILQLTSRPPSVSTGEARSEQVGR